MPKQSATASFDPNAGGRKKLLGPSPPSAFDCEALGRTSTTSPVLDLR